jgi:hypothetical protein
MTITHRLLVRLFASMCLSGAAAAQFSVSGPGALVPASGLSSGTYPTSLPTVPGVATVQVPVPVFQIDAIEVQGLSHTYVGDLTMVLRDPTGVEHLIWTRPAFGNGSTFGTSGDFTGGNYSWVESGAPNDMPATSNGDLLPGEYNQTFSTGQVAWSSGDAGIYNTPLSGISGPAGDWSLVFYDWYASADDGSFVSWKLIGNGAGGGSFCAGDGTGAICPCGNIGAPGQGCANSTGLGAALSAQGNAALSADTLVLRVQNAPGGKFGLFFQGTARVSGGLGALFGDGLRCAGGQVQRLQTVATSGAGVALTAGSLSALGGAAPGQALYYQYWYRDIAASPCGMRFNTTNALEVLWN